MTMLEAFVKERNEALFSLDRKKIEAYMIKYGETEIAQTPDVVFWASVYKAICGVKDAPEAIVSKAQPFLYTPWRKEHKDLAAIKVGDLVLTPGINMKAIQHFYDAIRKAFFKSEEYNWRWYKFRNRSEYVTYLRKHEEAE